MPHGKLYNRKGSSSTPGKVKGEGCQRSQLKNRYCFDTKFCRDKNYADACAVIDNINGMRKSVQQTETSK